MVICEGHGAFFSLRINCEYGYLGFAHWRLDLVDTWGKSNIARTLTVCRLMSLYPLHMRDNCCCSPSFTVQRISNAYAMAPSLPRLLAREAFFFPFGYGPCCPEQVATFGYSRSS